MLRSLILPYIIRSALQTRGPVNFHSYSSSLKLVTAINYAAQQHSAQRRKNSAADPYINHPIEVMHILASCGIIDIDTLCGAVLHDTVEDTSSTSNEIEAYFGPEVCAIVMDCSDDKSLDKIKRKQLQIEHSANVCDKAKLIKLADKYSNVKSMLDDPPLKWSDSQIIGYVRWSFVVCQQLYGLNGELDEKMKQVFSSFGITSVSEEELNSYYDLISQKT